MAKKISLVCNGKKLEITELTSGVEDTFSQKKVNVNAPGQGIFEISELVLSANSIISSESISCKATFKGKNIRQVYCELMKQAGRFNVGPVQKEYILSSKNRESKGILRPHWEAENEIEFKLRPNMRLLYCGESFTLACMTPERYGVDPDMQIWSLDGIYQRGGGEPFRVRFEFNNHGALVRKTGFSPASVGGVVSPFELLIEDGDTFEPCVTLINKKSEIRTGTVNPIMLGGGNLLHWKTIEACPGHYQVGLIIEDFDGQKVRVNSGFTIVEVN